MILDVADMILEQLTSECMNALIAANPKSDP